MGDSMIYIRKNSAVSIIGVILSAASAVSCAELSTESRINAIKAETAKMESLMEKKCTGFIDALPIIIDTPGRYCLTQNIDTSEVEISGIDIRSDDVTIDGQGFAIHGSADPATRTRGILAIDQSRVTIENLRIVGFQTAILFGETGAQIPGTSMRASDHASRDIKVLRVRIDNPTFQGIHIRADNFSITDSTVAGVGPSTVHPHSFATGIQVRGNNCEISRNRVALGDATGTGENVGIALYLGAACRIEHNTVFFTKFPEWGRNFGIWSRTEGGPLPLISGNLVSGAHYAFGPHGLFESNISTDTSCALFVKREDAVAQLIDAGENQTFETAAVVRPGDKTCPNSIERARVRYFESPGPEAAYVVALTYTEISPANIAETLAWLMVAANHGHAIAQVTASNPASGGYTEEDTAKALALAATINTEIVP